MEAKQIYDFILAFWRLVKKYTEHPPASIEDWDRLTDDAETLRKDHNTDEGMNIFHKGIILAWLDHLNYKEKHKQEG